MLHFVSVILSAFMAFGISSMPVNLQQSAPDEEKTIYYEDTGGTYGDTGSSSYNTQTKVTYTSKTLTATHALAYQFPHLTFAPAVGCCGAIAGGNVVSFYDRYDENLIPNHVSGSPFFNTFAYNIGDEYTDATITQLYEYMTGGGTGMTEDQFKSGLTRYCNEKGRSVSFTSCMAWGLFDYAKMQTNMKANQPIIFFLSGYNIMSLYSNDTSDTFAYHVSTATHIMIGFGYKSYSYETSSGVQNYDFVSVSSGLTGSNNDDFFDIHYQTHIDDALAVNIY